MTDSKTATERLRELLDERGVEWTYADGTVSFASDGRWYHAWAYNDGSMCVSMGYLTPEQAVAATLGGGECENIAKNRGEFECSECSFYADFGSDLHRVRSCPDCGKAVKR